jgi:hypothetical protein
LTSFPVDEWVRFRCSLFQRVIRPGRATFARFEQAAPAAPVLIAWLLPAFAEVDPFFQDSHVSSGGGAFGAPR